MNMEDIQEKVNTIAQKAATEDNEAAHALEDSLYIDFIKSLKQPDDSGVHPMQQLLIIQQKAKEVLRANELIYDRWYY